MLNDARGFKKIFLATGYTDLRRGMEGLAAIIRFQFELDLYNGAFNWPRTESQAMEITPEQYQLLMKGFAVVARHPIEEMENPPKAM